MVVAGCGSGGACGKIRSDRSDTLFIFTAEAFTLLFEAASDFELDCFGDLRQGKASELIIISLAEDERGRTRALISSSVRCAGTAAGFSSILTAAATERGTSDARGPA